jgi:plastocyanin
MEAHPGFCHITRRHKVMTRRMRTWATLLPTTLIVVFAACILEIQPLARADTPGPLGPAVAPEHLTMVIVPDALLGSNKRVHDAYIPANIAARAGQKVIVTVYNLDTAPHTFTAQDLHLNVFVPGAKAQGLEAVTTFTFTVGKTGKYHWKCILPCDNGGLNAWAMTHDGYMAGTITISPA